MSTDLNILKDKKIVFENEFENYTKVHHHYTTSIEQCKSDISEQRTKFIKELDVICDGYFSELSLLQQEENEWYLNVGDHLQEQNQRVISAIHSIQSGVDCDDPDTIQNVTKNTAHVLTSLKSPSIVLPWVNTPTFIPQQINHCDMFQKFGSLNKVDMDVMQKQQHQFTKQTKKKIKEISADEVHMETKSRNVNVEEPRQLLEQGDSSTKPIDVGKIRIKTIEIKGMSNIQVIVLMKKNKAWVGATCDKKFSLIRTAGGILRGVGNILKRSKDLHDLIEDGIKYKEELLVTCFKGHYVFKMTSDGEKISMFSDLSKMRSHFTRGLCATDDGEVFVCLQFELGAGESDMIIRLNRTGHIIQNFQNDNVSAPLYSLPFRVTSLPMGELAFTDLGDNRVCCVGKNGRHKFTLSEEIADNMCNDFKPHNIVHDNTKLFVTDRINNVVYVLNNAGTGVMRLLDNAQQVFEPIGIAIDDNGHLLVGCSSGKMHIIKY